MSTSEISRQLSVKTRLPLQFDVVSSNDSLTVDDNNDNEQNPHFDVKMSVEAAPGTMMDITKDGKGKFMLSLSGTTNGLLQTESYECGEDGERCSDLVAVEAQGGPGVFFSDGKGKVSFIPAKSDKAALACRNGEISWVNIKTCDQQ